MNEFENVCYLYRRRRFPHIFQHSDTFLQNTFHIEHGIVYSKNNPLLLLGDAKKKFRSDGKNLATQSLRSFGNSVQEV